MKACLPTNQCTVPENTKLLQDSSLLTVLDALVNMYENHITIHVLFNKLLLYLPDCKNHISSSLIQIKASLCFWGVALELKLVVNYLRKYFTSYR